MELSRLLGSGSSRTSPKTIIFHVMNLVHDNLVSEQSISTTPDTTELSPSAKYEATCDRIQAAFDELQAPFAKVEATLNRVQAICTNIRVWVEQRKAATTATISPTAAAPLISPPSPLPSLPLPASSLLPLGATQLKQAWLSATCGSSVLGLQNALAIHDMWLAARSRGSSHCLL